MTELDFSMRGIFLFIPFVPPLEQNRCYAKHIDAVAFNNRLEFFQLLMSHVSLAFLSASKKIHNSIRRKWCCPGFFQGTCVPSVHESYVSEWHRKLAGEACDTPKSMLFFLIITLWEFVCVQSYEISHLLFPSPQLSLWTFYVSLCKQMCFLGNDLATKHKLREFLVTVSVCSLNFSSKN